MSDKIKINFQKPVSNFQGDPIEVPVQQDGSIETDDEGNPKKQTVPISDHIIDLINREKYDNLSDRLKANRIMGLVADEQVGEYEREHIEWIIEKVENQMPVEDKAPVVMSNIADVLDIDGDFSDNENEGGD